MVDRWGDNADEIFGRHYIQFLERDVRTVVGKSFLHQCPRDTMQVIFAPVGELSTE